MEPHNVPIDPKVLKKFKRDKSRSITTSFFYLMKEIGISYSELMEMPVSAIFCLLKELKEHQEMQEKEYKKARRK